MSAEPPWVPHRPLTTEDMSLSLQILLPQVPRGAPWAQSSISPSSQCAPSRVTLALPPSPSTWLAQGPPAATWGVQLGKVTTKPSMWQGAEGG